MCSIKPVLIFIAPLVPNIILSEHVSLLNLPRARCAISASQLITISLNNMLLKQPLLIPCQRQERQAQQNLKVCQLLKVHYSPQNSHARK